MRTIGVVCVMLMVCSFDIPKGWYAAGSKPNSYEMGLDKGAGRDGNNCATIQSSVKKINGFGTLMQSANPEKYLDKRVRMTGYIKTENVQNWVGIWFRVDKGKTAIAFDNMGTRPIKGTTEWRKYEIVIDVAKDAELLAYGVLLNGIGKVWFDDIQFEIVDTTIPTTGNNPINLNFEEK